MIRLQPLSQPRSLDRPQSMMYVVKQMYGWSKLGSQALEQLGDRIKVQLGAPNVLRRQTFLRRFVIHLAAADTVGTWKPRHSALRAHCLVAQFKILRDRSDCLVDIVSVGVAVHQDGFPGRASEQLIDRSVERLASYVPQRGIHGANRRHRHRSTSPICALVEVLPRIFDATRIATYQSRDDMVI